MAIVLWRFRASADIPAVLAMNHLSNSDSLDVFLIWERTTNSVKADIGNESATLVFNFTNVSSESVTITNVLPACGCTTVTLPPLPWNILAGGTGQIETSVRLDGQIGTVSKTVEVRADKGTKMLDLIVDIVPTPVFPALSAAQRAQNVQIAWTNRQAIFEGDCALCHAKAAKGKYGRNLYFAICGICHEDDRRSDIVPNLHTLKEPTSVEFWKTMISAGKPGTLMPAFSSARGGPLTDMQILTLASYLDAAIPSHQ